jgi:NAD(P)-dependent dehydrogenase (short-subunit alcohol dehydrogenase family)
LFSEGKTAERKQRLGQPPDIVAVVAWLASENVRWITGQNIRANCRRVAQPFQSADFCGGRTTHLGWP